MHVVTESRMSDDTGNTVVVWRVDARRSAGRIPVRTLVKCVRQEHALRTLGTIRVSKPARFRSYGEGLVRDPSEGAAATSEITGQRINDPQDLQRDREFNAEAERCGKSIGISMRTTVKSIKVTTERGAAIRFGRNCWIYSTALEPTTDEQWKLLRDSLEPEYCHVDYIHRPSLFACSLGLMVVEQLGPRGVDQISSDTFEGEVTKTRPRGQLIAHGPVIYVEDSYRRIVSARTDVERVLLPIFVKECRFAGQREYRFVIWADQEPLECVVDLKISSPMLGALEERPPHSAAVIPVQDTPDRNPESTQKTESVEDRGLEAKSSVPLESTSDWFWPGLLGMSDNPATPLSRTIDPVVYADNPAAATTAAALSALRSKVEQVHGERRWKAASAAWHAEPWISYLCKKFMNPIGGISITDDDILIVSLKFPKGVTTQAKLSFGPIGARAYSVKGAKEQLLFQNSHPDVSVIPANFGKTLSRLGMVRWSEGDPGAK